MKPLTSLLLLLLWVYWQAANHFTASTVVAVCTLKLQSAKNREKKNQDKNNNTHFRPQTSNMMELTDVVVFVLVLYSVVTELFKPQKQIYTTSIEIATLLRKRRRLRSDSKRIGRRNARSLALFDRRAAEDDERYHAIRTAMVSYQ